MEKLAIESHMMLVTHIATTLLYLEYAQAHTLNIFSIIGIYSPVIIWLDICTAYFLRFKAHKEAGLTEKE